MTSYYVLSHYLKFNLINNHILFGSLEKKNIKIKSIKLSFHLKNSTEHLTIAQ